MRFAVFLLASLYLASCRTAVPDSETAKPAQVTDAMSRIAFEPVALCGALNDIGLVGSRWKQGAAGFGCATDELPVGPRDLDTAASSTVWYEVRGDNEKSVTTIVLGGDVRAPNSDTAVRTKLVEAASRLLQRLNFALEKELHTAILEDRPVDLRIGDYIARYTSEMVGKVRENRLAIRPAL
jgi:hypothetical protein